MRLILTMLCAAVIFSSCEKEPEQEVARKFISFEFDKSVVVAENPSAILSSADLTDSDPNNDIDKLTITARGNGQEDVTITLLGVQTATSGDFYSKDGNSMSVYHAGPGIRQMANEQYGTFAFSFVTVQDSLVEASFSGTLIDTTGALSPKQVRFGYIRAILKAN
jgi:hypothetical protein